MTHHRRHYQVDGSHRNYPPSNPSFNRPSYSPQLQPDYIQQLQEEVVRCHSLVAARDAELIQLRRDCSRLNDHYEEYRQANENLLREHNGLSRDLENTTNLANARGKELAGAQTFLSKADHISVAELREILDTLNEEIFQAAASLGDCVVRKKYDLSDEDERSCIKRLRPIVGKSFLGMLSDQRVTESNRGVNAILVQIVVQVLLVDRCKHEVDRWDPDRPDLSTYLTELYRGMRISEQQSVFGRWRALTLAQIKPNSGAWRKDVLDSFITLLEVAFWDLSSSHLDAFQNRLGTISKTVQRLRRAIGQDIISEDYKLNTVPPAMQFRTISMEEAYGDSESRSSGGSLEPGIVVGTTALGLMKMVVHPDGPQDSGSHVVLPKVVVDTSFRDILTASEGFSLSSAPR